MLIEVTICILVSDCMDYRKFIMPRNVQVADGSIPEELMGFNETKLRYLW